MFIKDITSLNLHDSDLISIAVRTTDESDEDISLRLDYLTDYKSFETTPKILVFKKCWGARLNMNFRVEGPDSILSAEEMTDSDFVNEIRNTWGSIGVTPEARLRHFVLKTSSTGSQLDIVAEELRLLDVTES